MVSLHAIPTEEIEYWWPKVVDQITSALERGFQKEKPEHIKRALLLQDAQLWVCLEEMQIKAVGVTTIMDHPCRKTCRLKIVTGEDRGGWEMNILLIQDWARSIGCKSMELIARPGWKRVLKDYEFTHAVLEKDL